MSSSRDFLIWGGGLAGLLLARELRPARVRVFAGRNPPPASAVAAGILNPITGPRLTPVADFLAYREEAVRTCAALTRPGEPPLLHATTLRRYLRGEEEATRLARRLREERAAPFLEGPFPPGDSGPPLRDPHGSFRIHGAARVETGRLLARLREEMADSLEERTVDPRTCVRTARGFRVGQWEAPVVLFAEGIAGRANPWLRGLPLRSLRGETLRLRCPDLPDPGEILQFGGKWLFAEGDGRFRLGATYERRDDDDPRAAPAPTPAAREQLLATWREWIRADPSGPEILAQEAGVRPASPDHRPYCGPVPGEPGVFVLNGLGSRGALHGPRLARQLAAHLRCGAALPAECLPGRGRAAGDPEQPAYDTQASRFSVAEGESSA